MIFRACQTIARVWKYSLGSFSDDKTKPYDTYVALVRSIILVSYLVTNCFIVAGVIRHWDNKKTVPLVDGSIVGVLY
jgi:hypothetical protein